MRRYAKWSVGRRESFRDGDDCIGRERMWSTDPTRSGRKRLQRFRGPVLRTLRPRRLSEKRLHEFRMSAIVRPARRRLAYLRISDIRVGPSFEQKVHQCPVTVERCVMQRCSRVVKTSGNGVELGASIEEKGRGCDVTVHARVDERIVDDALSILSKGCELRRQHVLAVSIEVRTLDDVHVAPGPPDGASFCSEATVRRKEGVHHVHTAQTGGDTQVMNRGTALREQIEHTLTVPIQRLLQGGPATGAIDGRTAVQ